MGPGQQEEAGLPEAAGLRATGKEDGMEDSASSGEGASGARQHESFRSAKQYSHFMDDGLSISLVLRALRGWIVYFAGNDTKKFKGAKDTKLYFRCSLLPRQIS